MNRRTLLSGVGLTLTASVAGCLSAIDGTGNGQGTAERPVRFWLEGVSLTDTEQESVTPMVFEELSTDEREIVQTAINDEEYTVEPGSESSALENLRDRIEQHAGNGETLKVYLRRDETYYRVGFVDGDHIIAHPDR